MCGINVLHFISSPENLCKLKASIDAGQLYQPTKEQCEAWEEEIRRLDDERHAERWELLCALSSSTASKEDQIKMIKELNAMRTPLSAISCRTSAKILQLVADATEPIPIVKEIEFFFAEQLYCEWAYLIDLDLGVFEVYSGLADSEVYSGLADRSCRLPTKNNRFDFLDVETPMCGSWPLDDLPDRKAFPAWFKEDGDWYYLRISLVLIGDET
ncbi:hypothetical protein HDU87_008503 [Geranomyces variabilis]|uniref:Uncharacterized protein n=1 Tax=Geranomyces variabilis TaxID=109894 RepID=A0AAD5TQY3_9FUNG|nr:hypothetical protein HDU87_008503 [Geranomyces variabilis]